MKVVPVFRPDTDVLGLGVPETMIGMVVVLTGYETDYVNTIFGVRTSRLIFLELVYVWGSLFLRSL